MNRGFIISLILILLLGGAVAFFQMQATKTAYVEINDVYNDFTLKKELESKLDNIQQSRKSILDSLELFLKGYSRDIENTAVKSEREKKIEFFRNQQQEYLYKQKNFEEDNKILTQQYSEQIWKQLNQYIKEYGAENGYDFLLGADGSGALMYAKETHDITREIKTYVNKKYKGEL